MRATLFLAVLAAGVSVATAQQKTSKQSEQPSDCPLHAQHMAAQQQFSPPDHGSDHDFAAMQKRGDEAMGFDQEKTTHHFLLTEDGGRIEIQANSANDREDIANIRKHLQHITNAFAGGDFSIPQQVHDQIPPGATAMQQLKSKIAYRYQELPNGAAVVISSQDGQAIQAIHDFLSFQITEHRTGDAQTMKH